MHFDIMKRKLYRIKTSGIGYNIKYNSTIKIEIKKKINNKQYLVIDFSKYEYLNK